MVPPLSCLPRYIVSTRRKVTNTTVTRSFPLWSKNPCHLNFIKSEDENQTWKMTGNKTTEQSWRLIVFPICDFWQGCSFKTVNQTQQHCLFRTLLIVFNYVLGRLHVCRCPQVSEVWDSPSSWSYRWYWKSNSGPLGLHVPFLWPSSTILNILPYISW